MTDTPFPKRSLSLRRAAVVLFTGLSLLEARVVTAQQAAASVESETDPAAQRKARASAAFETGLELAREQDFATAKQYFLLARSLLPHPAVSYNIALACRELGELEEAMEYLDEALRDADRLSETELLKVEHERRDVEGRLRERALAADAEAAAAAPRPVDEPRRAKQATVAMVAPPALRPPESDGFTTTPMLMVGAGAALLASAGIVYVWNGQRHDDWQAEGDSLASWQAALIDRGTSPKDDPSFVAAVEAHNERLTSIERVDVVSAVLLGGGALLTAGGLVLGLSDVEGVAVTLGPKVSLRVGF